MQLRHVLKLIAALVILNACVTINVYFPAAAAEQAADKIIEDVWGKSGEKPSGERKPNPQTSSNDAGGNLLLHAAFAMLSAFVPPANAQQADINISTPAVRQLTQSMEARHGELKKYYDSGAVGLTADGLVDVRDLNAVPLPERTAVRKLVGDENNDRSNLYKEIASANKHPEWEADIRKTFAQRWIQRAASGWYYNDGSGWKQK